MSLQNKKQFGVWMDSRNATVVGRTNVDNGDFIVMGHVENNGADSNSNEKLQQIVFFPPANTSMTPEQPILWMGVFIQALNPLSN